MMISKATKWTKQENPCFLKYWACAGYRILNKTKESDYCKQCISVVIAIKFSSTVEPIYNVQFRWNQLHILSAEFPPFKIFLNAQFHWPPNKL